MLREILAILKKDLKIEFRTHDLFLVMLVFAISLLFILNFALDKNIKARVDGAAGLIWIILVLSGQLGLNQVIGIEKHANMIDVLRASPLSRSSIFLGKTLSAFLSMFLTGLILLPLYTVFFNVSLPAASVVPVLVLGCWGYCALGTLISMMTIQVKTRDILLPILFFPLIIPLIVVAVQLTRAAFLKETVSLSSPLWIQLIVFNIIFTAIGILGFDIIAEE